LIIQGRYEIWRDGARIGEERFRVLGHTLESEGRLESPVALEQKVRITMEGTRVPVEVEITLVMGDGDTTRGRYRIDRQSGQLRSFVQPQTGASIERILPFAEDAELAFVSPLFQFITVGRLRLRPGERREVTTVLLAMPTLMPESRRRRWKRLPDVEIKTARAGAIVASDYLVEAPGEPALESRFQANLLGLPLRLRVSTPDTVGEYLLVE
jgi:hypothetical protein